MIDRILVPLDGSPAGEAVLPWVKRIAEASTARVTLLAAVYEIGQWNKLPVIDVEAEACEAERYLLATRTKLTRILGLHVDTQVVRAPAAEAILDQAKKIGADLIAMGTHGRSGVGRWVLGSVADKVVHEAHAPVLLARVPKPDSIPGSSIVDKVLVPLDGSDLSRSALPLAEELAELLDASIVLFHAVTPPALAFPGTETVTINQRMWDGLCDDAKKFLRTVGDEVSARGHRVEEIVSITPPVDGILDAAENQTAGLIVMSTHGRSGVGRWIMGSVTDAVVRRASLPVLVVRPARTGNKA